MAARTRRFLPVVNVCAATIVAGAWSLHAFAQSPTSGTTEEPTYVAAITADDVYVRSGPADSYYPFGKVNTSQFVKVMGEKYSWARVATNGPAFSGMFGFIKYDKTDAGKLRIDADGHTAVTLGRVDVLAPNMDAKFNPRDSWKALVKLEADQKLQILETIDADKEIIQKVALPEGAQGWIAMAYLRRATPEEASQWLTKATTAPPETTAIAANTKPNQTASTDTTQTPNEQKPGYTTPQTEDGVKLVEASTVQPTGTDTSTTGEAPSNTVAANTETPVEAKPAVPSAPPKEPTLDDLEVAFKLLQKEPIETAEVIPLRELYLALGRKNPSDAKITRYVTGRTDQLQIWADLQKKRLELEDVRARIKSSADDTDAAWRKLEASAEYTAVGRVAASTIYDGQSLPKLLRLQDAATGRTLAYLKPDEKYELVNLIGNLVGVVGDKTYDETLRLNIISPRRIDILTPTE